MSYGEYPLTVCADRSTPRVRSSFHKRNDKVFARRGMTKGDVFIISIRERAGSVYRQHRTLSLIHI